MEVVAMGSPLGPTLASNMKKWVSDCPSDSKPVCY